MHQGKARTLPDVQSPVLLLVFNSVSCWGEGQRECTKWLPGAVGVSQILICPKKDHEERTTRVVVENWCTLGKN